MVSKDQLGTLIRSQRVKTKLKFPLSEAEVPAFPGVTRLTHVPEHLKLLKALKKPLKYSSGQFSGPLLDKKVDTNESLIYYTRRYCAIKEKRLRRRP